MNGLLGKMTVHKHIKNALYVYGYEAQKLSNHFCTRQLSHNAEALVYAHAGLAKNNFRIQ